ncbi:MAG TPA: hypothetical protein VHE09_03600 [Rhizomicrobium sp.]|jgi:hypothetical protein|nr:hypothetical protein [Rhizomicrobium sp.]
MISKPILNGLAWAGVLIVSALVLKFAEGQHTIGLDAADRGFQVVLGLTLAIYANFMTKRPTTHTADETGARKQAALRLGAWLFCISGLIYAAASAFAPHPLDEYLAMGAVGTATLVSAGLFARACARRTA